MAQHRVVFEFESSVGNVVTSGSNYGWSEAWYRSADEQDDDAKDKAFALASGRRLLLTPGWSLIAARISRLDNAVKPIRRGLFDAYNPQTSQGKYGFGTPDEFAYDSLVIRASSNLGYNRAFSLRGIGTDVCNAGSRFLNPPQFNGNFAAWRFLLTGLNPGAHGPGIAGWALRFRTLVFVGVIRGVIIDPAVNPMAAPTHPVILYRPRQTDPAPLPDETVFIDGVLGLTHINAGWVIDRQLNSVDPLDTTILLKSKRRTTVNGSFVPSGRIRGFFYTLDQLNDLSPEYGSTRRTGRPLQLTRGRRSNRP